MLGWYCELFERPSENGRVWLERRRTRDVCESVHEALEVMRKRVESCTEWSGRPTLSVDDRKLKESRKRKPLIFGNAKHDRIYSWAKELLDADRVSGKRAYGAVSFQASGSSQYVVLLDEERCGDPDVTVGNLEDRELFGEKAQSRIGCSFGQDKLGVEGLQSKSLRLNIFSRLLVRPFDGPGFAELIGALQNMTT